MVSVIIPTYNAIDQIGTLLTKLHEQTLNHELIIIDSSSTDGTAELVSKSNARFYQITPDAFNHGQTRNMGVELATYDFVVFLTQDAIPADESCLERLLTPLKTIETCVMAYGRQLPYSTASALSQFARMTNYSTMSRLKSLRDIAELGIKTCHCSNSFAIYNKKELIRVGGFPTDIILGEDVTVAARFILEGYKLAYCAEAMVFHSHNYTISEEFKRYFDIGVFHQQQQNILKLFTRAESEGLKYIKDEWSYLSKLGLYRLIPEQLWRTLAKYTGYKLGRWYKHLPRSLTKNLSMHRRFWKNSTAV